MGKELSILAHDTVDQPPPPRPSWPRRARPTPARLARDRARRLCAGIRAAMRCAR